MLRTPVNAMDATCSVSSKGSLDFIMNAVDTVSAIEPQWFDDPLETERGERANRATPAKVSAKHKAKMRTTLSHEEKKRSRECKVNGCENYIINKGLCFRHGGGKKCSFESCQSSAKHAGLCWRHGGSVKCIVEECERRGKSRGLCWAHGGGTKCSAPSCTKVAVSNGCCWAHGGGKRCAYDGCNKAAYERTHNYCAKHHDQLKDGNEVLHV
ncbi:hypothetical protein L915_07114 [Phytophthora nicotianae]|uniref:WRKY19-like zinc finger domain-containing protein n=6 Tax=Phytophthora nicotianae TaxID=4792 RepID=V9FEC7_PHYNI|nr:hypothetical protein F443_07241 [Phytophthora nicotianae P1569]ETK88665.1 hypothetical protein L915_07114 [Phytophthora nicotianae]